MLNIRIKRKHNGVPILSRKEIDAIGEELAGDFCPAALTTPQPLDVDGFAEQYLHMTQDYQFLSHCGVYLGITVFNDTNQIAVCDPVAEKAKFISAKANTIIIDNTLLVESQEHRYRFTMGHEAPGHAFLHQEYFAVDPNQLSFLAPSSAAQFQCRVDSARLLKAKPQKFWNDRDWMEWQANAMASAFMMPESMVRKAVDDIHREMGVQYCKDHEMSFAYVAASRISELFNMSFQAANIRLKNLGLIRNMADQNYGTVLDFDDLDALLM